MPLFIFISGRFSQIKDRGKYKRGIIRIFETYIVFQTIWRLISLASGEEFGVRFCLKSIASPSWTLWYLVSIMLWRIMLFKIPEKILKERPLKILTMSIMVSILGGVIPIGSPFSLQRTMAFMPFFIMGFYSKRINIRNYVDKIPLCLTFVVIILAYLFYYIYLNVPVNYVLACRFSYWSRPEMSPILLCFSRCVLIISAVVISIMIMRIVPKNEQIAKWGANTLFIYMYHSFLVKALRNGVKCGIIPQNEWLLIVYTIFFIFCLVLLSKHKILNILLNPISNLIKK